MKSIRHYGVTIFLVLVIIVLGVLLYLSRCTKDNSKIKEQTNLVTSLNDSLRIHKDKDSNYIATIKLLTTERLGTFITLQSKDKEVMRLQDVVREYRDKLDAGSSVTKGLIQTLAEFKNRIPPFVLKTDTVKGSDNLVYVYPTYKDSVTNKWIHITTTMGKDSSSYSLTINNEFDAIVGRDKRGPFVDLKLYNPYSSVKELRSYQVTVPPPKRWGIGPIGGYGLGSNMQGQWFIGAGVQYNFIRF